MTEIRKEYHNLLTALNDFTRKNKFNIGEFSKLRIIRDHIQTLKFELSLFI